MAANSLGGLLVTLGLDASEFFTGLTRSEYEAKKFAERLDRGIATGAKLAAAGLVLMGGAAVTAFAAINQLAKNAGDFQDLAEKTGANAEALASFAVAAGAAGTAMADVAGASVKLTKNLTGVDDESKAAGAALAALNIPIKEFKGLDPAAQLETVAKALGDFAEGAGKTAVAVALFGKAGADLLPFLKEIGGETGRVSILTKEQIRLADEYSDRQARATATLQLYAQALATQALPAITAVTSAAKDFIKELLGMGEESNRLKANTGVKDFAEGAAIALATVVDQGDAFVRTFQVVGTVIAATAAQFNALARGDLAAYKLIQDEASKTIDGIIAKQSFRYRVEQKIAEQNRNEAQRAKEDRGFDPRKPLNFAGAVTGGKELKERTSEAERYLETLEKQLQGTLELSTEETALVEIYKLEQDALSGLTAERKGIILDYARQIDAAKELKKAEEERKRAAEESARVDAQIAQTIVRQIDGEQRSAQAIRDGNDSIKEQIAFLRGGEEAVRKITDAKLAKTIAEKEDLRAVLASLPGSEAQVEALNDTIAALRERQQAFKEFDIAKQFAAEKRAAEDFGNAMADSFGNAFEGFIAGTKSAKSAFKDFATDVERYLIRLALQNLGKSIFGGSAGGPDAFSLMAKFLSSFGGAGAGGAVSLGSAGLGDVGGGLAYAAGGATFTHAGRYRVGEQGPEDLIVGRGARIVPHSGKGGTVNNIVINTHVMPGATTASVMQTKQMVRDAVVDATRNR